MNINRWAKQLMQITPDGWTKRPRGRPLKRLFDNIREILTSRIPWTEEMSIEEASDLAQDRTWWRKLCHSLFVPQQCEDITAKEVPTIQPTGYE